MLAALTLTAQIIALLFAYNYQFPVSSYTLYFDRNFPHCILLPHVFKCLWRIFPVIYFPQIGVYVMLLCQGHYLWEHSSTIQ